MANSNRIIPRGRAAVRHATGLWIEYRERVFEPIEYSFVDRLFEKLDSEIVWLAEVRFNETSHSGRPSG